MAETTADVRRDIELTRERITSTLAQLERKTNITQIVKDNPWPAIGVAFGAGLLLSGTRSDVKAAGATLAATRGATNRLAPALDDIVARLMQGLGAALQGHVDTLIDSVKEAIGAPPDGQSAGGQRMGFADMGGSASGAHGSYGDASGRTPGQSAGMGGAMGGTSAGMSSAGAALGQRDEPAGGSWSPHTSDMGHGGSTTGGLGGSSSGGSTAGYTPSTAGSQGMPRAD